MEPFNPFSVDDFITYGLVLFLFAVVIGYIAYRLIKEWVF